MAEHAATLTANRRFANVLNNLRSSIFLLERPGCGFFFFFLNSTFRTQLRIAMDDAAKVLADPTAYADDARLHEALTRLRANNPVAWVDNPPYRPFWAITKHADIMAIERDNDRSCHEPRPLLVTAEADDVAKAQLEAGMGLRTWSTWTIRTTARSARSARTGSGPRPCATSRCASTSWPSATSTGCATSARNATSSPRSR